MSSIRRYFRGLVTRFPAALCDGWDGRRIRKLVLAGLAQRLEVARSPAKLGWDDLFEAARKKGGVEWVGGAAPTSREMFPDVPKTLMHDHGPPGSGTWGDHGHGPASDSPPNRNYPHTHVQRHDDDETQHS